MSIRSPVSLQDVQTQTGNASLRSAGIETFDWQPSFDTIQTQFIGWHKFESWLLSTTGPPDESGRVTVNPSTDRWALVGKDSIGRGSIYTSDDYGGSWNKRVSYNHTMFDVEYAPAADQYVAVGGNMSYSNDGSTWTDISIEPDPVLGSVHLGRSLKAVAFSPEIDAPQLGRGGWVAVGDDGLIVTSNSLSASLSIWQSALVGVETFADVAWDDVAKLWISITTNGTIRISENRTLWSTRINPSSRQFAALHSSGGVTIGVSAGPTTSPPEVIRSTNGGMSWSVIPLTGINDINFCYDVVSNSDGSRWLINGNEGMLTSIDSGQTWTRQSYPDGPPITSTTHLSDTVGGLAWGENMFYGNVWMIVKENRVWISDPFA